MVKSRLRKLTLLITSKKYIFFLNLCLPPVLPPEHGDERADVEAGFEEVPPLHVPRLRVVRVARVVDVVELDVLLVPERPEPVEHEARVDGEVKAVR